MQYELPETISDCHADVNALLIAIEKEFSMLSTAHGNHSRLVAIGGAKLTFEAECDIAEFSYGQSCDLIYVGLNQSEPEINFDDMEISLFDSHGQFDAIVHHNCRIWKASPKAPARLVLQSTEPSEVIMKENGWIDYMEGKSSYHDEGFDLARTALQSEMKQADLHVPVLGIIEETKVVIDILKLDQVLTPE